jgi:hypothetical protein
MYKKPSLLILLILFFLSHNALANSSKSLLAEMLRGANSLSNNLSVEQRIKVFESIQKNAQRILDEYPSSEEAILLLSDQKIGSFDLSSIQKNYIDELEEFYKSTCVIEPSAKCLAFVSLKLGSDSCRIAENFEDIALAQVKLKNAIRIFSETSGSSQIKNLAFSEFRNCAAVSRLTNQEALNDYFLSQLVPVYLEVGEEDQARAIVQKIDDPYLTFVAVIELTKHNESVNRDFLARMQRYVNGKKIAGGEKVSSGLDLSLLALDAGIDPEENYLNFGAGGQCASGSTDRIIFRKTIEYVERLAEIQSEKRLVTSLANLSGAPYYLNYSCRNAGLGEALSGYMYFRTASRALAEQYLRRAEASGFDPKELQKAAFDLYVSNGFGEPINRFPFLGELGGVRALKVTRSLDKQVAYPFSDYSALKISMLDGNLCNSVETLFKNYVTDSSADPEEVSDLLDFALSTNLLDSDEVCGDASLELLLQ